MSRAVRAHAAQLRDPDGPPDLEGRPGRLARSPSERHDTIKTALDEAAKLREQAADKLAEYEARIKDVDVEIKKLVEGIRADAEADKARILDNAAKQAAQLKKEAEQRIAAEIELARAQPDARGHRSPRRPRPRSCCARR